MNVYLNLFLVLVGLMSLSVRAEEMKFHYTLAANQNICFL